MAESRLALLQTRHGGCPAFWGPSSSSKATQTAPPSRTGVAVCWDKPSGPPRFELAQPKALAAGWAGWGGGCPGAWLQVRS